MRHRRLLLFLFILFLISPGSAARASASARTDAGTTVLVYHHFGDDRYPTTNISLDNFRQQMAYLQARNYQVIPLAQLVGALSDGRTLPDRSVVITIDDGYRSIHDRAWPILKSFGFPFTVFLYVEALEKGYSNYLTWAQVREMQNAGVEFQDHGYSHARLATPRPDLDESGYRQWLSADLLRSGRILQERLARRPLFLAIPNGEYSLELLEEAEKLGYQAILSQDPGSVGPETSLSLIPREPILGLDWSTIKHFEEILERVDLPIGELMPPPGRLKENPPFFSARIAHPERYDPGSFGIYVSQYGWLPVRLEGDLVRLKNPDRLTRRLNRVMVSAREKQSGRTALRTWLLVREEDVNSEE
jgi:peptidoglycan/xylan/chitin deacetylase (PgdA/CDA1 family)